MTISFLQTARYNATPRLARLDDGQAKPAPKFDSLDAMIAAMQKDAKAVNKAAGLNATPDYTRKSSFVSQDPNSLHKRAFRLVRDSGPISASDLANIIGVKRGQLSCVLDKAKAVAIADGYKWRTRDLRIDQKTTRREYWLEKIDNDTLPKGADT